MVDEPLNPHSQSEDDQQLEHNEAADQTTEPAAQPTEETSQPEPGISAVEDGEPELSQADQALLKVAELEEQLARRNADLYNLRQEYNGYVKRSKADGIMQYEAGVNKVLDILLPVLDDAALARLHGDLEGPTGAIITKLESTLETNFKLERFGAEGDLFDPNLHEALMATTSSDVEEEQISQLIQPGYKVGERILRPARVGVVKPE
ncbi:nucleotide exchange factor GrpE [Arcanobacterium pinnipediorum]|uniref:Protein GrpE n=1 Tax=Arcanobacterium pinnipediorum TaxID=1503041 RepID=A0ABY5AHR7_9ACTO|nr:nucleotide exchange factor GrpE [Arcanobacterium pinnipediorum]USR79551.1 nucleotide exchange factor GrpE [Arcanobacterium pinnipediorum]